MTESKDISHWGWKLALASAAAIWGGSFVVIKDALDAMPAAWLMALRFSLAAVILAIVFRHRLAENFDWSHLAAGEMTHVAALGNGAVHRRALLGTEGVLAHGRSSAAAASGLEGR